MTEKVNHPDHYNMHPSGVECLDVVEHMNFNMGNAIKYIWRADHKENDIVDLEKAIFYLKREIKRRGKSEEERTREPIRVEFTESDLATGTDRYDEETDYQKGRLWLTKHII
jgi:hypothetical protein